MSPAPFDTLKLARALREADFSTEQAEGAAHAIAEAMQTDFATKSDLRELRGELHETELRLQTAIRETETRLDGKLAALGAEMRAEIAGSKADTIKWTLGAIGFQTMLILGAVVALIRVVKP